MSQCNRKRAMALLGREKTTVRELPVEVIRSNPSQPRRNFDQKNLELLAQSIQENGLIQPIVVRRSESGNYEIVAGERRLRACRLLGMEKVPCYVNDCSPRSSALLAMAENMHRCNLQIFEEAEGIQKLISLWNVTQEEAAKRLGMSQSAVANKLRLLKLSEEERQTVLNSGLTERHARAVLRISDEGERAKALLFAAEHGLNVHDTEEYVEKLMNPHEPGHQKKTPVVKEIRIFINTIEHAVRTMKQCGINAKSLQSETDEYIECIVRIPKNPAAAGGRKPA